MAEPEAKAWTYTGEYPTGLHQTVIHPPQTTESEVLLRVHAAALNPVDIQKMNLPSHKYPWSSTHGTEKGIGMDFAGTVLASGKSVFKTGDEVFGMTLTPERICGGSIAEIAVLDPALSVIVKKPSSWSFQQAAALPLVWLTAKKCIESVASFIEKTDSKKVAILGGSSSTGIYSIILAKHKGWKIITTSSGKNREFAIGTLGADEHVDYTAMNVRNGIAAFKPDAVIDCVGGTECVALPTSKRYISIVGDKTGRSSMGGPYTYYDFWSPVRAATQWYRWAKGQVGLGESYDVVILAPRKEYLEEAAQILCPEQCFIDSIFPLDDVKQAFERLNTGRAKGKVVIKVA